MVWAHRGALRGFLTSICLKVLVRDPPAAGEQLSSSGGCSVLVEEQVSATPPSRAQRAVLPSAPAGKSRTCPWNGASSACPPSQGPAGSDGNEQLSMPKEFPGLGAFPQWSQLVVSRFCRCSRSLRSRFHRWSLPFSGTGAVPALLCGWRCC